MIPGNSCAEQNYKSDPKRTTSLVNLRRKPISSQKDPGNPWGPPGIPRVCPPGGPGSLRGPKTRENAGFWSEKVSKTRENARFWRPQRPKTRENARLFIGTVSKTRENTRFWRCERAPRPTEAQHTRKREVFVGKGLNDARKHEVKNRRKHEVLAVSENSQRPSETQNIRKKRGVWGGVAPPAFGSAASVVPHL